MRDFLNWKVSLLVLFSLFTSCRTVNYLYDIQNYVNLVSAYNVDGYSTIDFPPLLDRSKALVVKVSMYLYAINGFDEVAGNIELVAALQMTWTDEMPIIQSITFRMDQREEFLVPYDTIWTPKLVLVNAIGETSSIGDKAFQCRFNMRDNTVTWKPRVVISASCSPDVTYYPFDKQECSFVYTPWGFKYDEVSLDSLTNEWDQSEYDESGEWTIQSTSTEVGVKDGRSQITFKLSMIRKPLYFAFNILLPILVLCLLNATVFLLPAESGERVGFSVTCFLTFMVLLNMIMGIMPRSSNPISFLCYYLVVMMSNSGAMTLVTILLMRVYHKQEKNKVPRWMQRTVTFLNCGCAKLRCCVLCCRYLRAKCACEDKRKCGCAKGDRSVSEETLTEISVDKNNQVVERTIRRKKSTKQDDEPANGEKERSKCCFLKCLRNDNNSSSKCCCGCVLGCKKCKSDKPEDYNLDMEQKLDKPACFSCLRRRVIGTETDTIKHNKAGGACLPCCVNETTFLENDKTETARGEISCCFGGLHMSSEKNNNDSKPNTKKPVLNSRSDKESLSRQDNCFSCLRRAKVSANDADIQHDIVPDLDADILPDSRRSDTGAIQKTSFQSQDNMESKEMLIKRWENVTGDTTNKKGSPLSPIDLGNDSIDSVSDASGSEAMLKTKSIRAKLENEKNKNKSEKDEVNTGSVQKTRSSRSNMKENLPKPIVREQVRVPDSKRRQSKVSRVSIVTKEDEEEIKEEEDGEEGEVDSLADLEEEVTWPEVGRILDTFFFLAFAGEGQIVTLSDLDSEVTTVVDSYYDKQAVIPVQTVGDIMSVTVDLDLVSLVEFNDISRHLTLSGYLTMSWTEGRYTTISDDVNVGLLASSIWTPPIIVINSASQQVRVGSNKDIVKFNLKSGLVVWKSWINVAVPCDSSQLYPFDEHKCAVHVSALDYENTEMVLMSAGEDVCTEDFKESASWELTDTLAGSSSLGSYSVVEYKITIRRRSSHVVPAIVISVSLVTVLHLLVFFLPEDDHLRPQYSIISVLAVLIVVIWILTIIPVIASPVPVLVYYVLSELILNVAVTGVTVLSDSGLFSKCSCVSRRLQNRNQSRVASVNEISYTKDTKTEVSAVTGNAVWDDEKEEKSPVKTHDPVTGQREQQHRKTWPLATLGIFVGVHVCFTLTLFLTIGLI